MATNVGSVSNHFPSAQDGFTTTLASTVSSGATTVPLNSVAGYSNGEVAVFVVDPSNASKKQAFTGIIDTGGVQVTSVVWTTGTNQDHTAGSTVVDYATATHISIMSKGLLVEHNQAGRHALTSSSTLTSSKFITSLNDTNGNEIFDISATASAVNQIAVANAATGNPPTLTAAGGDTNINLKLAGKGTGGVIYTNPYKFHVYKSTAQNTANNAFGKVQFDAEFFDTGSNYDNATNYRFVAPIAGFYDLRAQVGLGTTQSRTITSLYKNGTELIRGFDLITGGSNFSNTSQVSTVLQLAANDYIEVFVFATGVYAITTGTTPTTSYFSGHLISTT